MTGSVDVLVVGAGITGIYQLYRALDAGFSATLLEAGDGVGGTWYWNRYPGARFDSESYTYGYLFSEELFDEWEWREHFAEQPETERYLNHVVDKFDLRRHIRFGARVTSAGYDESSGTWTVTVGDGTEFRARFFVAATGVLSVPYFPDVPGRDDFRGESYHTGLWPPTPVDFAGKRVAVIGTGSSGVQVIPAIAGEVASLTVYQRTANWCTPLNNSPITPDEQAELRAGFEALRETLNTSVHGFHHPAHDRSTFDDPLEERRAFYEKMWTSPGFTKLTSNYTDLLLDRAANAQWCEFVAEKIRSIVDDPETAEQLIPKDHRFGEKRPPFVTGYYETFNNPNVSIVDLGRTPILRMTETGIETEDGEQAFDIVVWATGFDFGTGALHAHGHSRPGRCLPRGPLGRRPEDVPRRPELGLPEPVLPRWAARGGRQQPAVQRRSGRFHHRPAHVRARSRLRHHRDRRRDRGRVDGDGRHDRGQVAGRLRGEQLLLRLQHPREAPPVPAELGRAPEAPGDDRGDLRERLQAVHTVATGVSGEPTAPGRRNGGAVSRKRLRSCSRSQVASSCRYHISPSGTPSLNRQRWWIGSNECQRSYGPRRPCLRPRSCRRRAPRSATR